MREVKAFFNLLCMYAISAGTAVFQSYCWMSFIPYIFAIQAFPAGYVQFIFHKVTSYVRLWYSSDNLSFRRTNMWREPSSALSFICCQITVDYTPAHMLRENCL